MNHSLTLFFCGGEQSEATAGHKSVTPAFMLRSVPASAAFEPRSNNKKKGDKRGVLGGI